MAWHSAYAAYKSDNRYLLRWMINTSNSLLRRIYSDPGSTPNLPTLNTTGKATIPELIAMSRLIAANSLHIPSPILQLLQSVIKARKTANEFFFKVATDNPDQAIEEQNASHKHFIDALEDIFQILGGKAWSEAKDSSDNEEDLKSSHQFIFANKFETLRLDKDDAQDSTDGSESEQKAPNKQNRARKSKKKTSKNAKRKHLPRGRKEKDPLESLPLEDYAFIEDNTVTSADYLVAVHELATEILRMRALVQSSWHDVAYKGKNSAVAAAVSHTAVAISRRSASDFFTEFAGHDSYEKIFDTITKSKGINANTIVLLCSAPSTSHGITKMTGLRIDPNEQLLVYAYHDMKDFIIDWQKTKSRKPTESMLAQIGNWDPSVDLQQLSFEERIRWRRSYTINWLYDLLYVYIREFRETNGDFKERGYGDLKWNRESIKRYHSPFFGLNDFAGFLFTLANQPYGTDISNKILPNHVFQLQCIVDSMTVSHGWSIRLLGGDNIGPLPEGYVPCRDVCQFLGIDDTTSPPGYPSSSDMVTELLDKEIPLQNTNEENFRQVRDNIWLMKHLLHHSLGSAKMEIRTLHAIPSRFSSTIANGLWEFSPYLCGIGLLESLELAYLTGMMLWDQTPEVMTMMHLHNKLVQKGYLEAPVDLFAFLQREFSHQFFVDGKPPTSKFKEHFVARMRKINDGGASTTRKSTRSKHEIETDNLHNIFDAQFNAFFRKKLVAHHLRAVAWDVERVPNKDLSTKSLIALLRICKMTESESEVTSAEDKLLLGRALASGIDDASLASVMAWSRPPNTSGAKCRNNNMKDASRSTKCKGGQQSSRPHTPAEQILAVVEADMMGDVNVLVLNMFSIFTALVSRYTEAMEKLRELQNPVYEAALWSGSLDEAHGLAMLARMALYYDNEECLRVYADAIQGLRYADFLYWDGVPEEAAGSKMRCLPTTPNCGVM